MISTWVPISIPGQVCVLLLLFCPCGHHLLIVLLFILECFLQTVLRLGHVVVWRAGIGQPRVHQQLRRLQPLRGRLPQHAADQALGLRRQPIGHAESPAADLGEQRGGLRVLKWVSSNQHGVQRHAQAPDVCGAARVGALPVGQQFGADVGGAAVSVRQRVVVLVTAQEDAVVEAEESETRPAERQARTELVSAVPTTRTRHFRNTLRRFLQGGAQF